MLYAIISTEVGMFEEMRSKKMKSGTMFHLDSLQPCLMFLGGECVPELLQRGHVWELQI